MQFMLAIYEDEALYAGDSEGTVWDEVIKAHQAFGEALAEAGIIRGGEGLQPTQEAKTLTKSRGEYAVHDGPYAETQEQLGGFYIIDVDTMDEALSWARRIPLLANGSVEVRPIMTDV